MSGFAAYYAERTKYGCWAVCYDGPSGLTTLMMTQDQIAAVMCAQIAEAAYKDGFEAGLVAQKYFPQEIRAFGYLPHPMNVDGGYDGK